MFTERLTKLRTEKKLTHQQIADLLGVTRQAYGNYESGKREPSLEIVQKLADFFEVTVDYLLGRTDDPSTSKIVLPDLNTKQRMIKALKEEASRNGMDPSIIKTDDPYINFEQSILDIFSVRVQKHRLEKGLSCDQLAQNIGLTSETIKKIETGLTTLPGQKTIDRISYALGVTRDYLLGYTNDPNGFGIGVYETDSRDIKKIFEQNGPVMYDGIVIEDEEDKEKLELLIRQAIFMVKEQNKKEAAKRKKQKD